MGAIDHIFYDLMKSHSIAELFQIPFIIAMSILTTAMGAYLLTLNFFNNKEVYIDKNEFVRNACIAVTSLVTLVLLLIAFCVSTSKIFYKNHNYNAYEQIITRVTPNTISFKIDENDEGLVIKYKDDEILASNSDMYHFIEDTSGQRGFEHLISIKKTKSGDYEAEYKCRCGKIKTYLMSESLQN